MIGRSFKCSKMWKVLFLLPCTILFAFGAVTGQDQRGTQFMLSFINIKSSEGNIVLLISAEERASVTITIPFLDQRLTKDMEPGETWKPSLPTDLRYKAFSTTIPSAVNVTSTSPVTVYVYDGYSARSSGFMALPLHALSTSYIAVTYNGEADRANPVLLLVAIMNDTTVDVVYRLSNGQCDIHTTGQTSSHTLHAYDVYGVQCTGDFTGTYVVSNKPLAVISGHENTDITGSLRDTLQEMLIPVDQFGLSFVLICPRGSANGSINRIVSSSDNTTVVSSIGETYLLSAYEYVDIDMDISGQQCINANFPVLVVSFTKSKISGFSYETAVVDAAMHIVPATSMFTTSIYVDYGLASVLNTIESVSIAFVFSRNDTPDFSASTTVHEVIPSCPYGVYTMTVTTWPVLFSGDTFKFGAYLYANNDVKRRNGVALPLNMAFANGSVSTLHVSSSTSESGTIQPTSLSQFPIATLLPRGHLQSSSAVVRGFSSSVSHHMIAGSSSKRTSSVSVDVQPTAKVSIVHSTDIDLQSSTLSPLSPPLSSSSLSSDSFSSLSSPFSFSSLPPFPTSYPASFFFLSSTTSSFVRLLSSSVSPPSSPPSSSPTFSSFSLSPSSVSFSSPLLSSFSSYSSSSNHGVYALKPATHQQKVCGCLCKTHVPWNITDELFEMLRKNIIDLLLLEPKNLSKTLRKLTSAQDNRPSAVAIGSVGTAYIVLTIVLICVPDVLSGLKYLFAERQTPPKVFQLISKVK